MVIIITIIRTTTTNNNQNSNNKKNTNQNYNYIKDIIYNKTKNGNYIYCYNYCCDITNNI